MRATPLLLLALSLSLGSLPAHGERPGGAEWHHQVGQQRYEREDYAGAIAAFEQAVAMAPYVSAYHRSLGRAYGRLAERSGWLKALELAKKTRLSLERAVALNAANIAALSDLRDFYADAPGFLGGGTDKAERIEARLRGLCAALHEAARANLCD